MMTDPKKNSFKFGTAVLLGWTNVGKSTLLNRIAGLNLSITAFKPQTTRSEILGIYNSKTCQIAFYDTPGIHRPDNRLSQRMINTAWTVADNVDVVVWMTVATRSVDEQYEHFKKFLTETKAPVIVIINKIDLVPRSRLLQQIQQYDERIKPRAVIPISALKNWNVDRFLDCVCLELTENPPMYPGDDVTDKSVRFIVGEKIRQQIILKLKQELPHVVAIEIEEFKESTGKRKTSISAVIYVERDSQKSIIIGKKGQMLKSIGTSARMEIEQFLEEPVHLQLWVKVAKNWRNDERMLERLGRIT